MAKTKQAITEIMTTNKRTPADKKRPSKLVKGKVVVKTKAKTTVKTKIKKKAKSKTKVKVSTKAKSTPTQKKPVSKARAAKTDKTLQEKKSKIVGIKKTKPTRIKSMSIDTKSSSKTTHKPTKSKKSVKPTKLNGKNQLTDNVNNAISIELNLNKPLTVKKSNTDINTGIDVGPIDIVKKKKVARKKSILKTARKITIKTRSADPKSVRLSALSRKKSITKTVRVKIKSSKTTRLPQNDIHTESSNDVPLLPKSLGTVLDDFTSLGEIDSRAEVTINEVNANKQKLSAFTLPSFELLSVNDKLPSLADEQMLPACYHSTQLTLLVRDPYCVYAFWEIADESVDQIRNEMGRSFNDAELVLRLYDVTFIDFSGNNANHQFDLTVTPDSQRHYVHLWCDNVSYCADLGYRNSNGAFFPIVRSNCIQTPPAQISKQSDVTWLDKKIVRDPLSYTETSSLSKGNGYTLINELTATSAVVIHSKEQEQSRDQASVTVNKKNSYNTKSSVSPHRQFRSQPVTNQAVKMTNALEHFAESTELTMSSHSMAVNLNMSSHSVSKAGMSTDLSRSSWLLMGGVSSSLFCKERDREQEDFFSLETELILYGRAEVGSEIHVHDKKMNIHSDGTFSIRLALPVGATELVLTVVSPKTAKQRIVNVLIDQQRNVTVQHIGSD